ncbi:DUF4097 family beta strand repeat-containing protein [Nonlabens marinus]|uniref:Adhesin domain-containing protein n=1 Tax=Nonlabens marinus S1-08 TaxID=1454201 RepID=W8W0I6_9FLAO|nr:hypothetical protein [Nonlabens marinus]BAO56391.1 hypothetical protein NMS_2382 [Nonlabens marinus S1-08]
MKYFNLIIALLLCSSWIATAGPADKYKKTKRINKTYNVNSDVLVDIENSFGDVTFELWNQNSVSIEVVVEVSGNNEESVNDRLRMIDVQFSASSSKVSAESEIPNENTSFFGLFGSGSKTNTHVDYVVKMPMNSAVDVENDYGAVIIKKMNGPLTLSCDFGRLQIGQLLNRENELSFDYTENSNIDYMKAGTIKADFSKFHLYGADQVNFSGDYTTARFGPAKQLKYNSDFSTIKIENAGTIDGRGDYSTVTIEKFENSADLKASFGKMTVNDLASGFKSLTIKSDYTTVQVKYTGNVPYDYEISTEFGSLKLGSGLNTVDSRKESTESYKQGYNVTGNSGSRVEINSSFGSVTLKSNN